jgi:serine/threonine protein kinase
MDLIDGKGLDEHQARFGDKPWAMSVLRQLAEGLRAMHAAGVVHRDLKPANVLISGEPEAPHAHISDFGISRLNSFDGEIDPLAQTLDTTGLVKANTLTKTGVLIGTPLYMAPEAAQGGQAVEKPGDVFAFGLVAHLLLTGSLPFAAPVVLDLQAGRMPDPPQALSADVDESVRSVLAACLAINPAHRPHMEQICVVLQSRR